MQRTKKGGRRGPRVGAAALASADSQRAPKTPPARLFRLPASSSAVRPVKFRHQFLLPQPKLPLPSLLLLLVRSLPLGGRKKNSAFFVSLLVLPGTNKNFDRFPRNRDGGTEEGGGATAAAASSPQRYNNTPHRLLRLLCPSIAPRTPWPGFSVESGSIQARREVRL
ncbi:hypothetical protein U9M48_009144 [Paspalum notatum var. saurae]|uniref:Uncharacterized protein n=1 Tax=Paspalum notatum var. saurae TaxID=547442 RepID=A0AAQ3SQR4_PASNO